MNLREMRLTDSELKEIEAIVNGKRLEWSDPIFGRLLSYYASHLQMGGYKNREHIASHVVEELLKEFGHLRKTDFIGTDPA
jgi:hypothetical protein